MISDIQQSGQIAIISTVTKNGSQHTTKAPVMIARVFAAFFSLFASKVSFLVFFGCSFARISCLDTSDILDDKETAPLLEDLSGDVPIFPEASVVNAVVCSCCAAANPLGLGAFEN